VLLQQAKVVQGAFPACNATTIGSSPAVRLAQHLPCTKRKHSGRMCPTQIAASGATTCETATARCTPLAVDRAHQYLACCADTPTILGMSGIRASRCSDLSTIEERVQYCPLALLQWTITIPVCCPPNTQPQPHAIGACEH
jgi:hypothetical protein